MAILFTMSVDFFLVIFFSFISMCICECHIYTLIFSPSMHIDCFFYFSYFFLMSLCVCLSIVMCATCMKVPTEAREGIRSPRIVVTGGYGQHAMSAGN